MHIGIIGSAGRGAAGKLWTPDVYSRAFHWLVNWLDGKEIYSANSGGAAWADHLLVSLGLAGHIEPTKIYLHLPEMFLIVPELHISDMSKGPVPGFYDTGARDYMSNPGGTLNYYHKLFGQKVGKNTLDGIARVKEKGAHLITEPYIYQKGNRLLARNIGIGRGLDTLLAFTWNEGSTPADGGTAHCWNHSDASTKIHINLNQWS